jgi:hypothetical protein
MPNFSNYESDSSSLMTTAVMTQAHDKSDNFVAYYLLCACSLAVLVGYVGHHYSAKISNFCSKLNLFGKKPGSSLRSQYATIPSVSDNDDEPCELLELKRTEPSPANRKK